MIFINLPLSWVERDESWIDLFIKRGLAPELGLDKTALELPDSWHRGIAARLDQAGLARAAHLPFFTPPPGDADPAGREKARAALRDAARLSALYGARHMVGHPSFDLSAYGHELANRPDYALNGQYPALVGQWIERSLETWRLVLEECPARLFLENTHDLTPLPLARLLENLPGRAGVCFDLGHWHSFALGSRRDGLADWIAALGPRIGHVHLHDNSGLGDEHLGLGLGGIPLEKALGLLKQSGVKPSATLEPHTLADFEASVDWLRGHPAEAEYLGFSAPDAQNG